MTFLILCCPWTSHCLSLTNCEGDEIAAFPLDSITFSIYPWMVFLIPSDNTAIALNRCLVFQLTLEIVDAVKIRRTGPIVCPLPIAKEVRLLISLWTTSFILEHFFSLPLITLPLHRNIVLFKLVAKTILRLSHLFQFSWAYRLFYKSIFKTTFSFLFNLTFKTYPSSVGT